MAWQAEWTAQRLERLRTLWEARTPEGGFAYSANRIAAVLRISKNAVVGKAHRLGLELRPNALRPAGEAQAAPEEIPAVEERPAPEAAVRPLASLLEALPVLRLEDLPTGGQCLWPEGDPKEAGFHFCRARRAPGRPYCAAHCAVAYTGARRCDE